MPIVSQKEVFAIEWKSYYYPDADDQIFAYFQYWGGGVPIGDWEDTVMFPSSIIGHQEHLNWVEKFVIPPVDCSNFSKDYLFSAIYDCIFNELYADISDKTYKEKYSEFYCLTRKAMEMDMKTSENYFSYYNSLEFSRSYSGIAISDDDYDEDKELAFWLSGAFDVSGIGGPYAIEDHVKLYFVQDVSKNQERLIWRNKYRHPDDVECRYIPSALSDQTFEAVMPAGYFKETIREFVRVAFDEIVELRKQCPCLSRMGECQPICTFCECPLPKSETN